MIDVIKITTASLSVSKIKWQQPERGITHAKYAAVYQPDINGSDHIDDGGESGKQVC